MSNNKTPLKIVITGPENSGKTALSKVLAHRLSWTLVPEEARTYLRGKSGYNIKDLRTLCALQCHAERTAFRTAERGLVCDTNALTIYIWAWLKEGVHNVCNARMIFEPDLYVLCYPDVPYEPDVQREDTGRWKMLFDLYLVTLMRYKLPFIIVRGSMEGRMQHTIRSIRSL